MLAEAEVRLETTSQGSPSRTISHPPGKPTKSCIQPKLRDHRQDLTVRQPQLAPSQASKVCLKFDGPTLCQSDFS